MCKNKLHDSPSKYIGSGFSKAKVKMLVKTGDFIFRCHYCEKEMDYFEFEGKSNMFFWVEDNLRIQYRRCRQCHNKFHRKHYTSNKDYHREYNKEHSVKYIKERRKKDHLFRLSGDIRSLINSSIRNNKYTKNSKTHDILGISFEGFKEHIEKQFVEGMSWDNRSEWHLDHIIPVSSHSNEEEIHLLNHHLNFQPLWAKDNLSKGAKYTEENKQAMLTKIRLWRK